MAQQGRIELKQLIRSYYEQINEALKIWSMASSVMGIDGIDEELNAFQSFKTFAVQIVFVCFEVGNDFKKVWALVVLGTVINLLPLYFRQDRRYIP